MASFACRFLPFMRAHVGRCGNMKISVTIVALILAMVTLCAADGHADDKYMFATGAWSQCSATCGTGAMMIREVRCIRKGSYNLPLPVTFCATLKQPMATQQCNVSPCGTPAYYTQDACIVLTSDERTIVQLRRRTAQSRRRALDARTASWPTVPVSTKRTSR